VLPRHQAVAPSPEPQAILTPISAAAIFLTVTVDPGVEGELRDLLSDVSALKRSVGFRIPEGQLTCVVGIGSDVCDRPLRGPRPAAPHPLPRFAGARHTAPGDARRSAVSHPSASPGLMLRARSTANGSARLTCPCRR
jgi:deferrochelatase/peroxidase EfeB